MKKVYLDENVISYLKGKNTIYDSLLNMKSDALFYYSEAHLFDLSRSDKNHPKFKEDLLILKAICGDNLLRWDKLKGFYIYNVDPITFLSEGVVAMNSLERKLKGTDLFGNMLFNKAFYKLFKFQVLCKENSLDEIMDKLDKGVKNAGIGKSLLDVVHKYNKIGGNDDFRTNFQSIYMILDYCGFFSDKAKKKSDYFNVSVDATHTFMASYCDIFCTCDKNVRAKAHVLYTHYGIDTQVVDMSELTAALNH